MTADIMNILLFCAAALVPICIGFIGYQMLRCDRELNKLREEWKRRGK